MSRQKKTNAFSALIQASRKRAGNVARKPWRTRTKRQGPKITAAERAERRKKREADKKSYKEALALAHQQIYQTAAEIHERFRRRSVDEIATDIFQSARLQNSTKDVGRYHAFVSMQAKILNAGVEDGQPKRKVNELSAEISAMWRGMSEQEKDSATKEALEELKERRVNREVGVHKPGSVASQDAYLTGERIEETLQRLNKRTGAEALLIIVSGSVERRHTPFSIATSERVENFLVETYKEVLPDFGARMDSWMVAGVAGVARNHVEMLLQLKRATGQLILRKLQECSGDSKISRMYYTNFADRITRQYGILVKNWPLDEFKNPSSVTTRAGLELLWNSWNSGTTHFHRMPSQEYEDWLQNYNAASQNKGPDQQHVEGAREPAGTHAQEQQEQEGGGAPAEEVHPQLPSVNGNGGVQEGGGAPAEEVHPQLPSVNGNGGVQAPSASPAHASASTPTNFVTMDLVTDANGNAIAVNRRPRKPRADRGKPRKKKTAGTSG